MCIFVKNKDTCISMKNRRTFSTVFYPRKDKADRNKLVPIYLRITVNGERAEIATGRRCRASKWKNGRVAGSSTGAEELRLILNSLRAKVVAIYWELKAQKREVTAAGIKAVLSGKEWGPQPETAGRARCQELNFGED
jgi:hypothetical protein